MSKILIFFMVAFNATFLLSAQQSQTIEQYKGHLRYNGDSMNIDKQVLSQILDDNSFSKYLQARREYVAAIPLWGLGCAELIAATTFAGIGLHSDRTFTYNPDYPITSYSPYLYVVAGSCLGAALFTLIPAIILTVDSQKKLISISKGYNSNRTSLKLSFCSSGGRITLNF